MIPFNTSLVRFEYIELKSVSTALGGSARIYDAEASEKAGKEVTIRYEVPFAVARQFQQVNKPASFMIPRDACLVWFGDQIVAIEARPEGRHAEQTLFEDGREWVASAERNFKRFVEPNTVGNNWFTDGTFIYKLPNNIEHEIEQAEYLTKDGMFRGVTVEAYKFAHLSFAQLIEERATRSVVACVHSNGDVVLTPPIWKNVLDIRKENNDESSHRFDMINEHFHVNLEFALNAGRAIGEVFGYDHIGPLKLDELMIHLKTVNLPKVPKSTRQTFGISMPFIQAFAWVAGKTAKCSSMRDFGKMRALMKQLCTKGIFRSQMLDKIYTENAPQSAPKLIDPETALKHVETNIKKDELHDFWRQGKSDDSKIDQSVLNAIGTMVED